MIRPSDAIGNPLTYYNGSTRTLTWKNGRQLATYTHGSTSISFEYNDEGIRTSKTVGGTTYKYYLNGSQIVAEEWDNKLLIYLYDASGSPIGMQYRTTSYAEGVFDTYWFEKNLQGDIVAVYNDAGTLLVKYTYDAWGNTVSTTYSNGGSGTIVRNNRFRYRGYYYDIETGFYYLNSRYYDPGTGRFVNADGVVAGTSGDIHGFNLYAYCFNIPVSLSDSEGNWPKRIKKAVEWVNENIIEPIENIIEDIENYDSNNQSEDVVFSSNYFSNYKGALVIKTDFDASFSFGFIGLSRYQQNPDTLKHEYGHTLQLKNMGIGKYIEDVAIPSLLLNVLERQGKNPYDYYSYPFEAEANRLGNSALSQSNKPPLPQGKYSSYWDLIKMFFE